MTKKRSKRKYLDDLSVTATCMNVKPLGRAKKWKKQRLTYGFDERDTWSLDNTMYDLLYERVRMYKDVNCVDLDFHKIEYNSKMHKQSELIDILLSNLELILKDDEIVEHVNVDIWLLWDKLSPFMWW